MVRRPVACTVAALLAYTFFSAASRVSADGAPATKIPCPHFDGSVFERILTGAKKEPVFVDIDTGRFLTPPEEIMRETSGRKHRVVLWSFTDVFRQWARSHGVDLAVQTDGERIMLVGFDLRVADSPGAIGLTSDITPAAVAYQVNSSRSNQTNWITFRRVLDQEEPGAATAFITREGGVGRFWLESTDLQGADSIRFDYQLTRSPDISKLTGQPVLGVTEPAMVGELTGFLTADITKQKLRLRLPGMTHEIHLDRDELTVRGPSGVEIRAGRLCTGFLDIDARNGRVTVFGRNRQVILRRLRQEVQIELNGQTAEVGRISLLMPEAVVCGRPLEWKTKSDAVEPDRGHPLLKSAMR